MIKSVFPPCITKQIKVEQGSSAAALCLFAAQEFAGPTRETQRQDAQKHTQIHAGTDDDDDDDDVQPGCVEEPPQHYTVPGKHSSDSQQFDGIYHQPPPQHNVSPGKGTAQTLQRTLISLLMFLMC